MIGLKLDEPNRKSETVQAQCQNRQQNTHNINLGILTARAGKIQPQLVSGHSCDFCVLIDKLHNFDLEPEHVNSQGDTGQELTHQEGNEKIASSTEEPQAHLTGTANMNLCLV